MYNVRVRRRPRLLIVRRAQPNSPASPERRGGGKGAGLIKEVQSPGRTIACPCAQAGTPAHMDNLFI